MKNKLVVSLPSDTEILQVRSFDAPPDLVYKAFTDPTLIPKWWGPRNTTTTVDEMDVRVGGKWRYIQHGDDGEYAFRGEYREIVPGKKVVSTFEFEPLAGHISVEHTTYEPEGSGTKLTTLSKFSSKEDRDGMLQSGMEQGAGETLDRFEELLAELQKEKV